MGNNKRLKKNKQRAMNRRLRTGKKPMCAEQKEARKKIQQADRERSKLDLEKRLKVGKKE